jgi:hypothetical protein
MKKTFLISTFLFCFNLFAQKEFYELRTYELFQSSSVKSFNQYFEKAFIPVLNKLGVKNIGVFKEVSESLPRKFYLLIPYESFDKYQAVVASIASDSELISASKTYNLHGKPMFNRYDTSLYKAFDGFPKILKPAASKGFFELRTYESFSQDAARRKVNMFNEGEIKIFDDVELGSVFFGEKIAGDRMPCLTYLLSFDSLEERNNNWDKFRVHPDWNRMKNDEAYKNSCCSSITRVFLSSLPFSQL